MRVINAPISYNSFIYIILNIQTIDERKELSYKIKTRIDLLNFNKKKYEWVSSCIRFVLFIKYGVTIE